MGTTRQSYHNVQRRQRLLRSHSTHSGKIGITTPWNTQTGSAVDDQNHSTHGALHTNSLWRFRTRIQTQTQRPTPPRSSTGQRSRSSWMVRHQHRYHRGTQKSWLRIQTMDSDPQKGASHHMFRIRRRYRYHPLQQRPVGLHCPTTVRSPRRPKHVGRSHPSNRRRSSP